MKPFNKPRTFSKDLQTLRKEVRPGVSERFNNSKQLLVPEGLVQPKIAFFEGASRSTEISIDVFRGDFPLRRPSMGKSSVEQEPSSRLDSFKEMLNEAEMDNMFVEISTDNQIILNFISELYEELNEIKNVLSGLNDSLKTLDSLRSSINQLISDVSFQKKQLLKLSENVKNNCQSTIDKVTSEIQIHIAKTYEKSDRILEFMENFLDLLQKALVINPIDSTPVGERVITSPLQKWTDNWSTFVSEPMFQENIISLIQSGVEKASPILSELISLKIVGESYYKWDSQNSYLPTIVCIFKELTSTATGIYRRSQIKLRYPKETQEVTRNDIDRLIENFQDLNSFQYIHGEVRANFVSKNPCCKTTVYVDTRETALKVLNVLCKVALIPFDSKDVSYTEGRNRITHGRRKQPLNEVPTYDFKYNSVYPLQLYRAVLLINGLSQPLILFRR